MYDLPKKRPYDLVYSPVASAYHTNHTLFCRKVYTIDFKKSTQMPKEFRFLNF